MTKYGMKFSTIRYFQKQAHDLHLYNGLLVAGSLTTSLGTIANVPARHLAYDAIAAAYVRRDWEVRNLLNTGSRTGGGR